MNRKHWRLRVFNNRVMRKIFGAKKDEVTGHWRKLHNEELHDLYCSLNVIWAIKSRRLRWTEHVARMGNRRGAYSSVSETFFALGPLLALKNNQGSLSLLT
jgi:hypothetical protein